MKPHACNQCNYSSNYKHDLKRHQKVHFQETFPNSRIDKEQFISSNGYPVQAMNLSNNINLPECAPNQVINIQPPHSSHQNSLISPIKKKPIIQNNNSTKRFDLRLKENFKLFISGPSRSGKTLFVKKLIENLDILAKTPPEIITLVYKVEQPIYHEMGVDYLVQDGANLKHKLLQIAQGRSMLCIFDDLINSTSLSDLSDLFVVDGRHLNLSLIFISQRIFVNSEEFRQISQNCDYFTLFRNPRNAQEIRTLATQMTPGKMELVKYFGEATQDPFSYLWLNLTQECPPIVKYLSHLFNTVHIVRAYSNGKMIEMSDLLKNGRTNFSEMYFKRNFHSHPSNSPDDSEDSSSMGHKDSNIPPSPTAHHMSTQTDVSKFDEEGNEIEMRERLRRLRDDWIDYNPLEEWDEEEDQKILRSLNSRNVGVQTDKLPTRNDGVQSDEIRTYAVGTDPIPVPTMRTIGTESLPGPILSSIGTDPISVPTVRNIGTDPISTQTMRNIGTDPTDHTSHRSVGTNTKEVDVGIPQNPIILRNERNLPRALQDNREVSPMEVNSTSRGITSYESTRPDRYWRLNVPLDELISRRNRYRNYNEYGNKASNVDYPIVPYQSYNEDTSNPHKCKDCGDIFRSTKALEAHIHSCKPSVFACSLCGKNLPSRNAWQSHVRNMHQTRKDLINTGLDRVIKRR